MPSEFLPCRLTDAEVMDRTHELLEVLSKEDALEAEKKRAGEQHKESMTIVNAHVRRLRAVIQLRAEGRDVPVEEGRDYKRGIVEVIRTDTGEIVRTRQMTEAERQSPLFEAEAGSRA